MSELDDIKARAAERRYKLCGVEEVDEVLVRLETMTTTSVITPEHAQAEADLDRAIAIADEWKVRALETARLYGELRKARAAVLKLREFISSSDIRYTPAIEKMLTETESYEQYR